MKIIDTGRVHNLRLSLLIFITLAILFYSCKSSTKEEKPPLSFSGAFALFPLAKKWAEEYSKIHPDVKFNIQAGGAGKGLTDALSGAVDVGMLSREITAEEKLKGIWSIALCKEAVLPTINDANPYIDLIKKKGLKKDQFKSIFIHQRPSTWDSLFNVSTNDVHKINVYTRKDAAGSAESWALWFGLKQADLKGTEFAGDSSLTDAVKNDTNAIAYSNSVFVFDNYSGEKYKGITIVPIDINGNGKIDKEENFYDDLSSFLEAVNTWKYPSPPARNLYFVTKDRPHDPRILDFFKWVLSDGQKFLLDAGYVPLKPDLLLEEVKKVSPTESYEH